MVKHFKECKVCGQDVKKTRSRPIDVCTKCKHLAWKARQEANGVDVTELLRNRRLTANKVYYDTGGGKRWLTHAEYQALLEKQGGVCAICGQPETHYDVRGGLKRLSVDHCHETGRIRGLLCGKHNRALGAFGDSIQGLEQAIAYLRRGELV